ncbi:hypothetical protein TBR22_A12470 [Luteitalea sp. TBR-22]|uniref:hybrid sensor histidine kinase/response regulator n=1 Tax=Luteitalea sp. TBR-22 TaxID=2802971 RepID=UPI001AF1E763|nr:ATP-binding protein [Luteitalea sp. TBR-22]BCS32042.1 hypothetical protein TBR22_A12470 [Luteitalea sp. TBR-22]
MRLLLICATVLQVAAVVYCVALLRIHRTAATAWLCLLGTLLSMLAWRVVVSTGIVPGPAFTVLIAIWGSVTALLAMFFFGREVARGRRAEAQRDALLESERAARTEAERASRIKDQFLATLSHELRTPLAAILGWCAILRSPNRPADDGKAVDTIERNARLQAALVEELLDLSRLHAGSLHLELAPVRLDVPVSNALDGVRPMAAAKNITIELACDDPPPVVTGDAGRLQQVAANLLVNGVKFSTPGGTIRVRVGSEGNDAVLRVEDDGMGIEPAFIARLFEPFWQGDSTQTRRHGGLGLGLSIVSRLLQLHGGSVSASSDGPGTGASFVVRLPRRMAFEALPPAAPAGATDPSGASTRLDGITAVLVDDEADMRDVLVRLLEQAGAGVEALASGETIGEVLRRRRPDVLLLDIGMPDEDGYALLQRIRRSGLPGAEAPAISVTAHAREVDRQRALASGFHAHLAKPVDVEMLLATVRTVVDGDRSRRAAAPQKGPEAGGRRRVDSGAN